MIVDQVLSMYCKWAHETLLILLGHCNGIGKNLCNWSLRIVADSFVNQGI